MAVGTNIGSGTLHGAKYGTEFLTFVSLYSSPLEKMPCTEQDFQKLPLDFVRDGQAIMWNNGTLYPIKGKFVDDSVCPVVPKGSTWARNPIPRIHTDNVGMAFVGKCLPQRPTKGVNGTCSQQGAGWWCDGGHSWTGILGEAWTFTDKFKCLARFLDPAINGRPSADQHHCYSINCRTH